MDYAALAKQAGAISSEAPPRAGETPGASEITGISAQPTSTGWRDSVSRWADNVMNDIKNGTDVTGIGTVLKEMGARGVYSGEPERVGDFMASLPLGLARMTKGGAEVTEPGQTWQGTKDIVGGGWEAAQIPAAFMGGPATEAGATAATKAAGKVFGSAEHAGQLFDTVRLAAKDQPIELTDEVYDALENIKQLADAGAKGTPREKSSSPASCTVRQVSFYRIPLSLLPIESRKPGVAVSPCSRRG